MSDYLCITIRWLGDRYHGVLADGETPEWPPSPYRLFQALLASGLSAGHDDDAFGTLRWIERQPAPMIIAPRVEKGAVAERNHFVPDNDNSLNHRRSSIRKFRPSIFLDQTPVHYIWSIQACDAPPFEHLSEVVQKVGSLGWATDFAFANAKLINSNEICTLPGVRWHSEPALMPRSDSLRIPIPNSLTDLQRVHQHNISRNIIPSERRSTAKPKVVDRAVYISVDNTFARPHVVFKLRGDDEQFFQYPQSKLIHIAGMVRHLAIELMKKCPPDDELPEGFSDSAAWVRAYVAGHEDKESKFPHRQFSYLPLPSIGHEHTDPSISRVMITAPLGHDRLLEHLGRLLAHQRLVPTGITKIEKPPMLVPGDRDKKVVPFYAKSAVNWASVTPVILPGRDDHKPEKTCKLIEKALHQSGVEQACEFEWSVISHFPKSLTAHKYVKDENKRQIGYIRPSYLINNTAVHLKLRFKDGVKVPGPIAIGAGRHCGLGLFAAIDE